MILFILDIDDYKKENKIYIGFTVFFVIFSFIYELFSHGVYSNFMIFVFTFPLIGLFMNNIFIKNKFLIPKISRNLFDMSLLTFSFGSIIEGVLEIYGTTNSLIFVYLIVGITLMFFSMISVVIFLPNKD
ncbi:MAG: hypothetical protein IKJ43_03455 [Bacilli bacterium]|nr:hypothetical protein [Bacilli bacterium]